MTAEITELHPFAELAPEDIEALLQTYTARFQWAEQAYHSLDDLQAALNYYRLLVYERQLLEAADVLSAIEQNAREAHAAQPDSEAHRELLMQVLHLSLSFTVFSAREFQEWPHFREMLALTEGRTGLLHMRHQQAVIGLVGAYQQWLRLGGEPESQIPEDRSRLNELFTTLDERVRASIAELEAQQHGAHALQLMRTYARHLYEAGGHTAGEELLRRVIDNRHHLPNPVPQDEADLRLELGQLLMLVNAPERAMPEFQRALELYTTGGDIYEMQVYQTEGWLEEAEAKLAA
jgi:tetratricopeptide (TPR) repeat protein